MIRDPRVSADPLYLQQVLIDLHAATGRYQSDASGAYTTTGKIAHEVVVSTSSSAVDQTLHANPSDGDLVTVKQSGTGAVTLKTEDSATIDGEATILYPIRYYSLTVVAFGGNWSIIHKVTPNTVMHS